MINLNNFNLDKNTADKLNSMLNNGNLNDLISQIPPDAMKNLSEFMNKNNGSNQSYANSNDDNNSSNSVSNNTNSQDDSTNSDFTNNLNNFDFNNIDINTMMKVKSMMEKMNNSSGPRNNLLQSLKPYLRDEKRSKLDQYSNLLNMANLMELFNQNNKENNSGDK